MREIVLDTETTGFDPLNGDRLVEIGCVELINYIPTGQVWHRYFNPQRAMPAEAFAVHGLSDEFLADKPLFGALAQEFLDFIDGAKLVIHNASFDMGFLNAELGRVKLGPLADAMVVDTLQLARRKHPGAQASLDALCKRYGIDNSARTKHGALLDAELLAEVYLELIGGRQANLGLSSARDGVRRGQIAAQRARTRPAPLPPRLSGDELQAHELAVSALGGDALWGKYRC